MLAARAERRPLRPVHLRDRHRRRGLAADAADLRARPGAVGRQRAAVPRPERRRCSAPTPERADQPRLRGGLQRGQGARRAAQHDPHRRTRPTPRSSGRTTARRSGTASSARSPTSQDLDIADSARLFAMANLAAADAAIGCWNNKYYWSFWRPITAIREADSDGNPATEADPTWMPLFDPPRRCPAPPLVTPPLPRPPVRPQLRQRRDRAARCRTSSAPTGSASARSATSPRTTRSFDRFSDALKENIDARVWAGIHFRTADVQGAVLGKKVAHYLAQALLPAGRLSHTQRNEGPLPGGP